MALLPATPKRTNVCGEKANKAMAATQSTLTADTFNQSLRMTLEETLVLNSCACSSSWRVQQSGKLLEQEWLRLNCHKYSYTVPEPENEEFACVEMEVEVLIAPVSPLSAETDEAGAKADEEPETY